MIRLPWPVRKVVRSDIDDLAVERIWQRLNRRRVVFRTPTWSQRQSRLVALCTLALVVLTSIAMVMLLRPTAPIGPVAGPIRVLGGAVPGTMAASATETRAFSLSDGSMVTLRPNSKLEVLENNAETFVALVSSGAAGFKVQPGGPRRWTIECGLATIDVVGTRFSVLREPARVRVDVEHGVVLVRGDRVRDRVQRLTDGQSLEVTLPSEASPRGDREVADAAPSPPETSRQAKSFAPGTAWQDYARRGDYAEAYGLLGPGGVRHIYDVGGVQDLLTVADVARLSGHPTDAVPPLRRIVSEFASDPNASLAAFTLGRVELDALGDPAASADAFARAIALGPPQGLLEDAFARLVEARARAHDLAGARRAADEYRARFPEGVLARDVARWTPAH